MRGVGTEPLAVAASAATKMSMSAEKKIDSVFSKFMKRYLRLPHFCNNDVIHFFTRTEPLSVTLKKKARDQFYSITFPSGLSGFRPTMFQDLPASLDYIAFKEVPSKFWICPIPTSVSPNPTVRREQSVKMLAPLYAYYEAQSLDY